MHSLVLALSFIAVSLITSCTPAQVAQAKQDAKTAVDVSADACVAAQALGVSTPDVLVACNLAQEVTPVVEHLLQAKQKAVLASCPPPK